MNLTIYGAVKSKKNNKRIVYNKKTNKPFIISSSSADSFMKDAVRQLREQFKDHKITGYPIPIQMVFYYQTKHRKDLDNSVTTILDCMKDAGIIEDDDVAHINEIYVFFGGYDKENPRVEIILED